MEMKSIERIDETSYQQFLSDGVVIIADALIEKIDFTGFNFSEKVVIHNCLIRNLHITGCWFEGGLVFNNVLSQTLQSMRWVDTMKKRYTSVTTCFVVSSTASTASSMPRYSCIIISS